METRQELLARLLEQKKPICPHCNQEMTLWEVPPITYSDGLGWGSPFLFVCYNDECPPFKSGWDHIGENYAHKASYRCMCEPDKPDLFEFMPVFGNAGGEAQIINEDIVAQQEAEKERMKIGFSILADCYVHKDVFKALQMLLDTTEPIRVRIKAAELIGDISEDTEAIDPMRNTKFPNAKVQEAVNESIKTIHKKCFTKECPYCAEIIKQRAKLCKHCGKEMESMA